MLFLNLEDLQRRVEKLSDKYLLFMLETSIYGSVGSGQGQQTICSLSRCLTSGKEVKTGGLPHSVSFVCHLDLRSRVSPTFQSGGVMCELYILNVNEEGKKKKNNLSEQKQVSPPNRRLSDLSARLNRPVLSEHDIKQNNRLH